MKPLSPLRSLALAVMLVLFAHPVTLRSADLEALSRSDKWQVRYCVAAAFQASTPGARAALERLAQDQNARVAWHAFSNYTRVFVDVDFILAEKAFDRGDFNVEGITVSDPKVLRTPSFWRSQLKAAADEPG